LALDKKKPEIVVFYCIFKRTTPFDQYAFRYSKNGTLTVFINDLLQNKITDITKSKGFIGFQSEGCEMEFKNLIIK